MRDPLPSSLETFETESVRKAFDAAARQYDQAFDGNPRTRALRDRLYSILGAHLPPPAALLDIGCGTGTDAIQLARRGYAVTAVDVAEHMIEFAREKGRDLPNVHFCVGSFEDLSILQGRQFDAVLTNFGGLNCTPRLRTVFRQVLNHLRPGGVFVAVFMTRFCFWEFLRFALKLDFHAAFRRSKCGRQRGVVGTGEIPVYYHSVRTICGVFPEELTPVRIIGLNVISPPPASRGNVTRSACLVSALDAADRTIGRIPLVRSMGDHVLAVLQKRSA